MSRDTWRCTEPAWRLALVAVTVAVLGCGRGDAPKSVARAGNDGVGHLPSAAAEAPTPGFTSAQGTPPARSAHDAAPAVVAARMAPPAPASVATRTSAEEQAALRALPAGPGHELVLGSCLTCHAATMLVQQHKDTAGWNKTVTQMIAWGAPVATGQQATLVGYLVEHYPARAAGDPARKTP